MGDTVRRGGKRKEEGAPERRGLNGEEAADVLLRCA
jgi:hypothetical protein